MVVIVSVSPLSQRRKRRKCVFIRSPCQLIQRLSKRKASVYCIRCLTQTLFCCIIWLIQMGMVQCAIRSPQNDQLYTHTNWREPLMDQNIMLVGTGLFLLLGLGIIGYSVYVHLHGMPVSQEQWRKDLIRWRVLGPNTLPQTLEDVKRCRDYLLSMGILASGICLVLAMIGWAMALLATGTSAADSPNQNNGAFFLASALLSVGIGLGSGAVFAAWRFRNAARRGGNFAELWHRRLSHYWRCAFLL